jgi:hypothetical protein
MKGTHAYKGWSLNKKNTGHAEKTHKTLAYV